MNMKRFALMLSALLLAVGLSAAPKTYELASPDGGLRVSISAGDGISYTLTSGEDVLLENSAIGMFTTDGQVFGGVQPVSKAVRKTDAEYNGQKPDPSACRGMQNYEYQAPGPRYRFGSGVF